MSPDPGYVEVVTGRDRAKYGCMVSFENADGETLVLHRLGAPRAALEIACDDALALDPTFRVTSYSTPQTIYADLQGREAFASGQGFDTAPMLPEAQALGRAGRRTMLHPRLKRSSVDRYRPW